MTFSSQSGWGLTLRTVMSTSYRSVSLSVLFIVWRLGPSNNFMGLGNITRESLIINQTVHLYFLTSLLLVQVWEKTVLLLPSPTNKEISGGGYVNNILLQILPSFSLSVPLLLKTKPLKNLNKIIAGHPY